MRANGKLLRIFVDEKDRYHNQPVYFAVVNALRSAGFSGASVFKGIEGFGRCGAMRTARVFDLSTNLPVLIEVVEEERKILEFLPLLQEIAGGGLVTLENLSLTRLSPKEAS
jgi:hypothetical protein